MSRSTHTLLFLARCVVIGLALAFVIGLLWPGSGRILRQKLGIAGPASAHSMAVAASARTPASAATNSYADAVDRAAPSVVNIYANKLVTEQPTLPEPMRRIFGNVPTGPARTHREQSLGSGVIVNDDGYVLTNNHVIADARNIQALLYDGRVAHAKVVGHDRETDLAVLKLDVDKLPAISLAREKPRVGDTVLAIGNPLGIGQTVTEGIVSAIGRQLSSGNPESFIQTDAAINFGNSGGALVNARGRLVGINTAMLGHADGTEGISFAIPLDTARNVMHQIIQHGEVVRSWLGLTYTNVPPKRTQKTGTRDSGVLVTGVYPDGPGAHAGIHRGDLLLKLNGKPIRGPAHLYQTVSRTAPGSHAQVSGMRAGKTFNTAITMTTRPKPKH